MATDSPNPKYDAQSVYNKFQATSCNCDDKQNCSCPASECSVCPPGLVAIYDECGKHLGCLTPNDAEHFNNSRKDCPEGYVKVIHPLSGDYLGCLAPEDAFALLAQLSPSIDPVATPSEGVFVLLTTAVAIAGAELTSFSSTQTINVDRVSCQDPLVIQLGSANPAPTGVTITGGLVAVASTESTKDIEFNIPNTLGAGVYTFDLEVIGCGVTKVATVTLTLS